MKLIKIKSAGICFFQKVDTAKQCCFTGTARSHNSHYLAIANAYCHIAQHFKLAISLYYVFCFYQVV